MSFLVMSMGLVLGVAAVGRAAMSGSCSTTAHTLRSGSDVQQKWGG